MDKLKRNDLISIMIPAYNVDRYIDKCLETLCSQTYSNIEIVIVDDGSTDTTGKKCDEWAGRDDRIRVIHQENRGVSGARNACVRNATGEYVAFVDPDDMVAPEALEQLVMRADSDELDGIFFDSDVVYDSPELAKLVKEGIKSFFAGGPEKTMSDEEVLECLFASEAEELDNIPLPLNNPYLSDTGVVFLYTQYEIAPYSSGIITFEIPFAKILPFLTKEAKDMIK